MPRFAPIAIALALTAIACPKPGDSDVTAPPGDSTGDGPTVPAGAVDPGDSAAAEGEADAVAEGGCLSDADCPDGHVCEGEGCGDDQPGTCGAPERMCTRDSQPYCGCDGQSFRGSGSCPGRRYASKGACEGDPATP